MPEYIVNMYATWFRLMFIVVAGRISWSNKHFYRCRVNQSNDASTVLRMRCAYCGSPCFLRGFQLLKPTNIKCLGCRNQGRHSSLVDLRKNGRVWGTQFVDPFACTRRPSQLKQCITAFFWTVQHYWIDDYASASVGILPSIFLSLVIQPVLAIIFFRGKPNTK
jgi:hypothetical protein